MKLTFIGATHEVTGSCTLIEINGRYGVVDFGTEQGENFFVNQPLPVEASKLEFILLTHAHVDHSGNIPLLFKQGADCPIYATEATCHLCEIMLQDCAHIQESEAEWQNRKNDRAGLPSVEPVYTLDDALLAIKHLRPVQYHQHLQIAEGVEINMVDAGHLMGSASIEVFLTEGSESRKVVFSGDIGNTDQPLINDPSYLDEADYIITESTYGDRLHEKEDVNNVDFLASCIQRTLDRGGNVVIPSFAVGRTQEMLYFIREIKTHGLVTGHGDFPVYIDSPMANEATAIFLQCDNTYFDEEANDYINKGINPLMSDGVKLSISADESKNINFDNTPKVIISASGMCNAGRIKHHLKHNLWRPESMILFVGYQSNGTIGRSIIEGAKHVKLFNEDIDVRAEICQFHGMSGHADMNGLIRWIGNFKKEPKMVFVNHGEDKVTVSYAKKITEIFGFKTSAPFSGSEFDLISGEYTKITEGVHIEKPADAQRGIKPAAKKGAEKAKSPVAEKAYEDLVAAAEKLLAAVKKLKGHSNRELRDLTDDINYVIKKSK